ncbi:MAG: hypothetical protein JWL76_685 [Thermoleophilia bacterium]|nr:hypothetical protein [Thermoleophilia bacterium]
MERHHDDGGRCMNRTWVELQMPFVDSSVAGLRYLADGADATTSLPVVASRRAADARWQLVAEVLGCSHRIELRDARDGSLVLEEVVACDPALPAPLPARDSHADGHAFTSSCERVAGDVDWDEAVEGALAALEAAGDESLVARFPDPRGMALTAISWRLSAVDGRASWSTIHAYPGERSIVHTSTIVDEGSTTTRTHRSMTAGRTMARIAGIAMTALLLAGCGLSADPKSYVAGHYDKAASKTDFEKGSAVYTSPRSPATVARDIIKHRKPASKRMTPSGWYLRYSKYIIAIRGDKGGGSRIMIDRQARGYARHYGGVGGWWGTSSGRAESFRGGGPGVGK